MTISRRVAWCWLPLVLLGTAGGVWLPKWWAAAVAVVFLLTAEMLLLALIGTYPHHVTWRNDPGDESPGLVDQLDYSATTIQ